MNCKAKTLYLYDPIRHTKQKTTYKMIIGITGKNVSNLMSMKNRRLKINVINCYIVDDNFTKEELQELYRKEKIEGEIWKKIKYADGTYEISDYGRTRRRIKGVVKLLIPFIRKSAWMHVKIKVNGKYREYAVHRLVAEHFVFNESGGDCAYHKNENIWDNYAGNLEWLTREELGKRTAHKSHGIPVKKIDIDTGEVLDEYDNMAQAGRDNYLHRETIRLCINGELKTAGGFKWEINEEEFGYKEKASGQ